MYYYHVFGLPVQSTIELEVFRSVAPDEASAIKVSMGSVRPPAEDLPETVYGKRLIYNPDFCYLELPEGQGAFLITRGTDQIEVILDFRDADDIQTLMAYFYATGLSAILQLTNRFALHASGILFQGQVYLFCGRSGIGKSTLAAQLKSQGYPLFTDDKCVVRQDIKAKTWKALPGLQVMRLWENSVSEIGTEDFLEDPVPVVFKSTKFQFRVRENELVHTEQILGGIYIIQEVEDSGELDSIPLRGIQKMRFLKAQIFRHHMIRGFKKEEQLWNLLHSLAQAVPVYLVRRPKSTPIKVFGDFVLSILEKSHQKTTS